MREYLYELTHREIMDKGIQYAETENNISAEIGNFLTYYRYEKFGASDPATVDAEAPISSYAPYGGRITVVFSPVAFFTARFTSPISVST